MNNLNQKPILLIFIGIFLGGIIGWIWNTVNVSEFQMMENRQRGNMNTFQTNRDIDQHFIEQMIPHHEDAIVMAEIALEKAQTNEVRQLATNIIKTQTRENEQMKVWYQEWYDRELPSGDEVMNIHGMGRRNGMHMGMMGNDTDITRLSNSSDFDRDFVEQMIPHHQMAVMMASMLRSATDRSEMQSLADNIITTQTKEIEDMRTWLDSWNE